MGSIDVDKCLGDDPSHDGVHNDGAHNRDHNQNASVDGSTHDRNSRASDDLVP